MKDLLHDPLAAWIVAGTLASLVLARTRFAKWSVLLATLVLLASVEGACFDGERHLTNKFDATFFVWAQAVERRAVSGMAFALLGAPLGAVVSHLARRGRGRGWWLGALALGPFGAGQLASSLSLQRAMRTVLTDGMAPDAKLGYLRTAVGHSTWLLGVGTIASVLAGVAIAVAAARAPATDRLGDGV